MPKYLPNFGQGMLLRAIFENSFNLAASHISPYKTNKGLQNYNYTGNGSR